MLAKAKRYIRLRAGQKRRVGYQYRYQDQTGWTPWLAGEDELFGEKIGPKHGVQYRAPRVR